jgi:hypothetical protein
MNRVKKGRDIIMGHFFCPIEISVAEHGNTTALLRREGDFEPICIEDLDRCFSDIDFVGINIAAIKIGNLFTAFRLVFFKPLSESGRFINREFSPSIYSEDGFYQPFDLRVSQETIDERGEKGSKATKKIGMGEKPIPKGSSCFIEIFCLGDEVQFRDINARGTDHITEVASNA